MKTVTKTQPARISAQDIQSIARKGVERALAARQNMVELSQYDAEAVGGGAVLGPFKLQIPFPIRAGGFIGPISDIGGLGPVGALGGGNLKMPQSM